MLPPSPSDSSQTSFFDILSQLDCTHPLMVLGNTLDWSSLEASLGQYYSSRGRAAKPIRLMSGLLMLKQLYNLSDEAVVAQWCMNPYFQVFCGEVTFQTAAPCHATELVKFRRRIGASGVREIFALSVRLHGEAAQESTVLVDTTVQEKAITYPTDSKLAIRIINRLNKLAKLQGIVQRRTYVKEVKSLRLACRHFRHVRRRRKAVKAVKRLRTIAGILMRELERKLPEASLPVPRKSFALYRRVLSQQPKDRDKIYSLHEPDIYCVGKGKDHKPWEYGRKASVVSTRDSQVIIGVVSHDENVHDSRTLGEALSEAHCHRRRAIDLAVVDRPDQRRHKRMLCRRRAAIEPIIGHLKADYRLTRNWLRGSHGDQINLMMAACAWNLRKWMIAFFWAENPFTYQAILIVLVARQLPHGIALNAWVIFQG